MPPRSAGRLTWTMRYRLGAVLNERMAHDCTLQELGDELGITKQNAYTESVLALGTLAWELCTRLGLPPDALLRMAQRKE